MHCTGVKPQLRKCYQKSYIYEVCLFSSVCTQLCSIVIIFMYNIVDKLLIFSQFEFNRAGGRGGRRDRFFLKNANFRKAGGGSSANMYKQGGQGSKKGQFFVNVLFADVFEKSRKMHGKLSFVS